MKTKKFKYIDADDDSILDYYKQLYCDKREYETLNDKEGMDHVRVMLLLVSENLKKRGLLNDYKS
jgi:hypothetical protein